MEGLKVEGWLEEILFFEKIGFLYSILNLIGF